MINKSASDTIYSKSHTTLFDMIWYKMNDGIFLTTGDLNSDLEHGYLSVFSILRDCVDIDGHNEYWFKGFAIINNNWTKWSQITQFGRF